MSEIFISYSRRDKEFVLRFLSALKENGYTSETIWVDWEDIPASSKWEDEIRKGIEASNSIIFILSPEWIKSNECAKELQVAAQYNKRLFPIVWQNVDPNTVAKELASLNWIFFRETDNFDEAMQKLLAALKTDLEWVADHTKWLRRANEWEAKGRDGGYLLRGNELQLAETWLSHAAEEKQPRPAPLQSEYIFTSRQDDARRQRRNLIWTSVGLVVSLLLAIAAVISGVSALRAEQRAVASQLSAESLAFVDTQPDLSLLLSLEGNYIGDELNESDPAWLGSLLTALNNSPKLGTYLRGHTSDVRAVAFSSDGRWLATAGGLPTNDQTGEIFLWDMQTQPPQSRKLNTGGTKRLLAVAFSADNKTLVAAGNSGEFLIWNTDQCCEVIVRYPASADNQVRAIKFVELDGEEYLAAAIGNQITFWDMSTGEQFDDLTLDFPSVNKVRVLSLAFSPVTNALAAGGEDGSLTVWDLASGEVKFDVCSYGAVTEGALNECDEEDDTVLKEIRGLAFNRDATLLLSGSTDQFARVWDAETGELLAITPHGKDGGHINTVTGVAFNPQNDNQVATVSWDNTVILWNLFEVDEIWEFEREDTLGGHSNSIWATAFSPDGKLLASVSSDYSAIIWKVNQINQIGTEVGHMNGSVWALAVSQNGKQFAAGDDAGFIQIWDFDGTTLSAPVTLEHPDGVYALAYSHNGKWLASAGYGQSIRIWDAQSGKLIWEKENAHADQIWSLMFSPDDQTLASASYDKTVKFWDVSTHEVTRQLTHDDRIFALTYNGDGTQLLVAGYKPYIYLWDLTNTASDSQPELLAEHIYSVNSLTYNPVYPPLLASTSDDKTLLIWHVAANAKESAPPVRGLRESMEAVTFSPNGNWLASATNNSTVLLWQLDAEACATAWDPGRCKPSRIGMPLVGHQAPVQNVLFLSDTALISSSEDGQLILWNLDKSFWYQHACTIVQRTFDDSERSQYTEKVNTTLLNIFGWFDNLFSKQPTHSTPECIE